MLFSQIKVTFLRSVKMSPDETLKRLTRNVCSRERYNSMGGAWSFMGVVSAKRRVWLICNRSVGKDRGRFSNCERNVMCSIRVCARLLRSGWCKRWNDLLLSGIVHTDSKPTSSFQTTYFFKCVFDNSLGSDKYRSITLSLFCIYERKAHRSWIYYWRF